jgi:hypothetical protein
MGDDKGDSMTDLLDQLYPTRLIYRCSHQFEFVFDKHPLNKIKIGGGKKQERMRRYIIIILLFIALV